MTDPSQLIRELDVEVIRTRLDELDGERAALMVLLRAAQRSHKVGKQLPTAADTHPKPRKEVR